MIKLDNNFTIKRDAHGWMIEYEKMTKKMTKEGLKQVKSSWVKYPANLKHALEIYADWYSKDETSLHDAVTKYTQALDVGTKKMVSEIDRLLKDGVITIVKRKKEKK